MSTAVRRKNRPHPAVYTDVLLPHITELLRKYGGCRTTILDPFGGEGVKFAAVCEALESTPVAVEIERGYFDLGITHPCVIRGDSTALPFPDWTFGAAVSSPVYPNGVADDFVSTDESWRHTYAHRLREHLGADYRLDPRNTGGLNPRRSPRALEAFYEIHRQVWAEVYRVLPPGAPFVVNTKDPLHVPFRRDTWEQLIDAGFEIVDHMRVRVNGLNHGKNWEGKAVHEDLTVAIRARPCTKISRRLRSLPYVAA